jgi:Type II secretion system (T2SS), protein F
MHVTQPRSIKASNKMGLPSPPPHLCRHEDRLDTRTRFSRAGAAPHLAAVLEADYPRFSDAEMAARRSAIEQMLGELGLDHLVFCGALGVSYPSLCANIHVANLEIRAGRTMIDALEHLADRLGLEEARSFATLVQQSDELGSSICDALRVYSDEMRHKRMSRAEEKAYALPAKLSVPMMLFIFPVLFIAILCPVIVRFATSNW